jgi:hypothetical protein
MIVKNGTRGQVTCPTMDYYYIKLGEFCFGVCQDSCREIGFRYLKRQN